MDDFSDDGFDDLNANALQELENHAIQFTQAHKKGDLTQQQFDSDFEDDDLDDAVVTDELHGKPILPSGTIQSAASSSRLVPPRSQQQHNAWGPTPAAAPPYRPQAIGTGPRPPATYGYGTRPSDAAPYSQMLPPPQVPRPTPGIPSRYQASQTTRPAGPSTTEQAALQAQIRDLQARLTTKDGEIQIVRNRLDKFRQDHEREVQVLKKQTAEQLAKQEREVETARLAQRSATTELEFTRRDLREELDRAKRKDRDGPSPKKKATAKAWGVSDGFEDVEMAGSPTKGNGKRNTDAVASIVPDPPARLTRTPTKGKRKRPATTDSPVMALETTEDVIMLDESDNNGATKIVGPSVNAQTVSRKPLSYDFLKVILNHSSDLGRPSTFDILAGIFLPSKPGVSIASILFQKLALLGDPSDPMRLPIEFCAQVIELWLQCRKEGCLTPIAELISLISFTLQLNTIAIAPYIAESVVSAAMDSCYEVGIPRRNKSVGEPMDETYKKLKESIPTSRIVSLMYLTALGCITAEPLPGTLSRPIVDFWSCIHPDFIFLMIRNHNQPVDDFIGTLKLLCTSSFQDSIGPISTLANRTVDLVAPAMIERLSFHLLEVQQWGEMDVQKQWIIRYSVLRTLAAFAQSPFGMKQLALNDHAIPRLVTFLSWCIEELYSGDGMALSYVLPSTGSSSPTHGKDPKSPLVHEQPNEAQVIISHVMLLLHTIITDKANQETVDVTGKLAKFIGGSQKYLLSLARLNFAEEGVSEETAELAHELLELAVTEEEGEELGEFFGG